MTTAEHSMLKRIADLMLGGACRAANLVADDETRLVLTPHFGGLILPTGPRTGAHPR